MKNIDNDFAIHFTTSAFSGGGIIIKTTRDGYSAVISGGAITNNIGEGIFVNDNGFLNLSGSLAISGNESYVVVLNASGEAELVRTYTVTWRRLKNMKKTLDICIFRYIIKVCVNTGKLLPSKRKGECL